MPSSNLDRNIIRHHAVKGSQKYVTTYYKDGMYKVFEENLDPAKVVNLSLTQSARTSDFSPLPIISVSEEPKTIDNLLDKNFYFNPSLKIHQ